jgi:hypothetical protein
MRGEEAATQFCTALAAACVEAGLGRADPTLNALLEALGASSERAREVYPELRDDAAQASFNVYSGDLHELRRGWGLGREQDQ